MSEYAGLGLFMALGAGTILLLLVLTSVLGPRLRFAEKDEPFECGESPLVSPYRRFPVKFYMVPISFIIFDLEVGFLYPWAVVFRDLGWYGLLVAAPFLSMLSIALAYEWMKGAREWE